MSQFLPVVPGSVPGRSNQKDLRGIAYAQRGVLVCILVYVMLLVCQFAAPESMRIVIGVFGFLAGVAGAAFVFMLATRAYNIVAGVILGILTIIPVIGLLILLIINGRATRILRDNGYRVGLLGARG